MRSYKDQLSEGESQVSIIRQRQAKVWTYSHVIVGSWSGYFKTIGSHYYVGIWLIRKGETPSAFLLVEQREHCNGVEESATHLDKEGIRD